jgi:two-component system cell cycle sensor histidine kinase/response regulator CckA
MEFMTEVFITCLSLLSVIALCLIVLWSIVLPPSRNTLIATHQGWILLYRTVHPLLATRSFLREVLRNAYLEQSIELDSTLFLIRRRKLPFYLIKWELDACSDALARYALKKMLQDHPWPSCIVSQEGTILFPNLAFSSMVGYSAHALEGREFLDLFQKPPADLEALYRKIYMLNHAQGYGVPAVISHIVSTSEVVTLFLSSADFGAALGKIGDVSLLSKLPVPSALLDEHGGVQVMNALMRELLVLGAPSAQPLAQWIDEKDRHPFSHQLKQLRKTPGSSSSLSLRMRQGKRFLVFLTYLPSHDGIAPGHFLSLFSMEESSLLHVKEAEPHRMQLLGQLAGGIVHDFNNLLTGILGFCDLLLQRHSPQEASFKDIEQIKQSSMRAARLIKQLLAFSKSTPLSYSPICLKKSLHDLFPLMRRMVGPKILLSLLDDASPTSPANARYITYGDNSQMEQILLNLAINARDAMPEGGVITFYLRRVVSSEAISVIQRRLPPGSYVVVDIKDTGSGIEAEHLAHIFDPFFSTKDPGQGTGLGLSNVLSIVEQFEGGINVDTKLGHGTTFSLYFLLYQGQESVYKKPIIKLASSSSKSKTPSSKGIRILLVEDEDPIRLFAARALREDGHEVIEARDGAQALRFLQSHPDIQVIVTDVMMPGVDGPSLAISIQELYPQIKILFVSGYPKEEVMAQLHPSMKEVYFLPKPFALAELVSEIQHIFKSSR